MRTIIITGTSSGLGKALTIYDSKGQAQSRLSLRLFSSFRLEEPLRLHAYARHERDAHWIAAQLQAHGIPVEVRLLEWDEIQQPERLREADMILFEAVLSQREVSLMELYQFEHPHHSRHQGVNVWLDGV